MSGTKGVSAAIACNFILTRAEWLRVWVLPGRWWLTPVILATQEAEIRRIEIERQSQANSL
jgi:hypothetical protein